MPVISIRVSDEWLSYVDAEAERCRWKRNAAVVNLTWDGLQMRGALDKEKRDGAVAQLAEQTPRKRPVEGSITSGTSKNCPSCGGMNGMHQRGCKG